MHNDPTKRHDFVFLFDVVNGNPNGDPDAGNLPRIDPETMHGLVTDVALKRKVRDFVALNAKQNIFIQSQVALNTLILRSYRDIGVEPPKFLLTDDELIDWFEENKPEQFDLTEDGTLVYGGDAVKDKDIAKELLQAFGDPKDKSLRAKLTGLAKDLASSAAGQKNAVREARPDARKKLCETYYDIRMFGAVLSTGLNAGQVRGPMQLTFARSVDPIQPIDLAITRQARTTTARMATGATEMGRKSFVPYGLYRAHGFFSPALAAQTGVVEGDLKHFWSALTNMFDFDRSAARGEMSTRGLYVFTHDSSLGNAPAHKLFDRVVVERKPGIDAPRRFMDYEVRVPDQGPVVDDKDGNKKPLGVTLAALVS